MADTTAQQLVLAIEELMAHGTSERALARAAGVSPMTLRKLLRQRYIQPPIGGDDARRKRPWAEAITRLVVYVNARREGEEIDLAQAAVEAGLSADDVITRAMRKTEDSLKIRAGISDAVLSNISNRAQGDYSGVIRYGVLRWPPFADEGKDDDSWAHRLSKRLLGTLNPTEWQLQAQNPETIDEALNAISGGACDVVFGLYDSVARRLRGFSFINLPGIGVPLDAIYFGHRDETLAWEAIASPPPQILRQPFVYVLQNEVGEMYIRGPCGYDPENVETLTDFDPRSIARRLINSAPRLEQRTLFVADRPTCLRVHKALQPLWTESRNGRMNDMEFRCIGNQANGRPVYRLGFALRAEAMRWDELICEALVEELFRNDRAWTEQHYADLLRESYDMLSLLPLEPQLPRAIARPFVRGVQLKLAGAADEDRFQDEFRKNWLAEEP